MFGNHSATFTMEKNIAVRAVRFGISDAFPINLAPSLLCRLLCSQQKNGIHAAKSLSFSNTIMEE